VATRTESLEELAARLAPPAARAFLDSLWPIVAGLALAFGLHFVGPSLGAFYSKVLMDAGINIVLAVSLTMVNGFTGQFSIGHAAFMAVGAYSAGAVTYYGSFLIWGSTQARPGFFGDGELLFVGACLCGGLVAAAAGYVVGLPSLRLRGDYLAIVTLGFGEILRVLLQRTPDVIFSPDEIRATPVPELLTHVGGSLGFTGLPFYTNLFWVYAAVTAMLLVAFRLKESTHGRAFLSIREDEVAAEAMGIPTTRVKVTAFVLAALFAGIAGGLFAHEVGTTVNPRELGFQKSFDIIIMVVLGGMGSISGAVLAAVALTVLPELLRAFSEYRMIIYALVLIIVMILRPQGLFGIREIWELGRKRRKAAGNLG
jgi:branched-chain amino acid transport system permease protein